jgi:hypothetical protein
MIFFGVAKEEGGNPPRPCKMASRRASPSRGSFGGFAIRKQGDAVIGAVASRRGNTADLFRFESWVVEI